MPVPYIDYDQQAVELLPTEQRKPLWIVFMRSMFWTVRWLFNWFTDYTLGDTPGVWNTLATYNIGDRVKYGFSTYESTVTGNLGNAPDSNPDKWMLRNEIFIGALERTKYNGQKIIFEYALNRYFGTTFRQPPLVSDIYIQSYLPAALSFIMYPTADASDKMFPTYSTGYMFYPPVYSTATTFLFNIYIPVAVYAALGTPLTAENIVRQFADKYAILGTGYGIITY